MSKPDVMEIVHHLAEEAKILLKDNFKGFYLHGSLAMGGFNPDKSDVDILIVTYHSLSSDIKSKLAKLLLKTSNTPFPIEVSFLNEKDLSTWQHPCPFDFHYSEFWREGFEEGMNPNSVSGFDPDLAAHITIIHHRGICVAGESIKATFPNVPREDYLSAILGDYFDCLVNIKEDPVYSVLNMIRVYWYLKEEVISSKYEAGKWALKSMPDEFIPAIKKIVGIYSTASSEHPDIDFTKLYDLRDYIDGEVQKLMSWYGT
ncbi:aminoglycoside adenylyltransferase domain-containing protein [Cytobacillus firmus]|uniref:aminoglycoside adenylyltransferase domain-containing protein n=1 Tax=Cytobacillus firmus TaxID=1399 RepID=UPI002494697C|nr:aminoglycoside adenylyltransferase domain-containing protein [Cytobacillus firmus]